MTTHTNTYTQQHNGSVAICSNLCRGNVENLKLNGNKTLLVNMDESKAVKEYLKGEIDNFEKFNELKLGDMVGKLYVRVCVCSVLLFVNKCVI